MERRRPSKRTESNPKPLENTSEVCVKKIKSENDHWPMITLFIRQGRKSYSISATYLNPTPYFVERFDISFEIIRNKIKHFVFFTSLGNDSILLKYSSEILHGLSLKAKN